MVPGGIAVDLDAAAKRQHEAAMGPAEAADAGAGADCAGDAELDCHGAGQEW